MKNQKLLKRTKRTAQKESYRLNYMILHAEPSYDLRYDRFELALEAENKINKSTCSPLGIKISPA